jgi:6-phosphogluconate dehydrogenase
MRLGLVGLGRMGGNMAARVEAAGHEVVGYDAFSSASEVASLTELVERLEPPRVVWVMVPAGDATEAVVGELAGLLASGDVVVDGGNSNWRDSVRRGESLGDRGIGFVDAGTSGGVWGRTEGYCLMVGGDPVHVAAAQPVFDALTPVNGGFVHAGKVGTGHFTKMVHNGVEYGMMQAYAEGYELLVRSGLGIDVPGALDSWREGSVVRSWLLDLFVRALQETPGLEGIAGVAHDSGEGRWMLHEAVDRGVATPVTSAALFARFVSQADESPAMKAVAALRHQFGGHAMQSAVRSDVPAQAQPDAQPEAAADPAAKAATGEG